MNGFDWYFWVCFGAVDDVFFLIRCNEIVMYNATMTTESLGSPHATMSHPWGTGAIPAIVHGVMGIQQTSAAWSTFTVKPLISSLKFANITVPTIRGPIVVVRININLSLSFSLISPHLGKKNYPVHNQSHLCLVSF